MDEVRKYFEDLSRNIPFYKKFDGFFVYESKDGFLILVYKAIKIKKEDNIEEWIEKLFQEA